MSSITPATELTTRCNRLCWGHGTSNCSLSSVVREIPVHPGARLSDNALGLILLVKLTQPSPFLIDADVSSPLAVVCTLMDAFYAAGVVRRRASVAHIHFMSRLA